MPSTRSSAERYRHAADAMATTSPRQARVAAALARSDDALAVLGSFPARARPPAVVLAALHDLVLAGGAPALAAAWATDEEDTGPRSAAGAAAVATLVQHRALVAATAVRRPVRPDEGGRYAVLRPAVAEAARRAGATAVGLVDVGRSAGLNLQVDRVGITYGAGPVRGDADSPVQVSASVVGDGAVPADWMPAVVARVGVDADPLDVTDADDARWLRACLGPDQPARAAGLAAEIALARTAPPELLGGDVVDLLPAALARVPPGALPVVTTTWAFARLSPAGRERFRRRLAELAADRPLAWVSAEGVGVVPGVPTLGDRPASGHSILAVGVLGAGARDGAAPPVEAVGRCWSRGRLLSWLATG